MRAAARRHVLGAAGLATAGLVAAGGSLLLAIPAPAATVSAACTAATSKASSAESAFQSALTSYKKEVAKGGHPDSVASRSLQTLESSANQATSVAARACVVTASTDQGAAPVGPVDTGLGGSVHSASAADVAAGVGLVALAGCAGLLVLRRRRPAGAES